MLTVIAATKPLSQTAEPEPYLWAFGFSVLVGLAIGYAAVWLFLRQTRRLACEKAQAHQDLAKREAALASQELINKAEEEIRTREADLNRDLDRRKIEIEMMLREIRSHEESLGLLDYQLEQRQERLSREATAIKQARDATFPRACASGSRVLPRWTARRSANSCARKSPLSARRSCAPCARNCSSARNRTSCRRANASW
jgi:hypothetical protein